MGVLVTHDRRPLPRAFAASLFVHALLFALLLPILSLPQSAGGVPVESLTFAHAMRVRIDRPAAARAAAAVPEATAKARTVAFARRQRELTSNRHQPHAKPTAKAGPIGKSAVATAPRALHSKNQPLFAQTAASSAPADVTHAQSMQTPAPQATLSSQDVASNGASDRGGQLPFGAEQNPVLDPAVRKRLQSVNVHVTLLVTVGDDGRTKSVVFQPPIDSQLEHQIQSLLASANWDAAVCGGGITCEGVATIKL